MEAQDCRADWAQLRLVVLADWVSPCLVLFAGDNPRDGFPLGTGIRIISGCGARN